MQLLQLVLSQIFPNASMYLSATFLSGWIIVSTGTIRLYWREWVTYRNKNRQIALSTDIPNLILVLFTFLIANLTVLVALIATGQINDPNLVLKYLELANSTAFTSNGIYSIVKHSILPWITA